MKATKYFLLFLMCQSYMLAYSQQTTDATDSIIEKASLEAQRRVVASLPDSILAKIPSLRKQADEWKQKTIENPKDEKAWISYVTTVRMLESLTLDKKVTQEIADILNRMKQCIPNTATYDMMQGMFAKPGERKMSMKEIMDKWPDAVLYYPVYMNVAVTEGGDNLKKFAIRWYKSGTFPPEALNFAYNQLASAEKNALIFVSANDAYGCYVLQYAKGMFTDKRIIVFPYLLNRFYMKQLTQELGIPEFKEEQSGSDKTQFSMGSFYDSLAKYANHLAKHGQRPVYFSILTDELMRESFKKDLYAEGLLMKYSEKPYDNLAIMRRNFESTYLLDYLKEIFHPESTEVRMTDNQFAKSLNLSYVPSFRSLLQFYKESDDQTHYDKLYQLLYAIVRDAKFSSEDVRERYLKSIRLE